MSVCDVTIDPTTTTVTLNGSVVASTVPSVRAALLPLVAEGATITIDCAGVDLIDSMGIGVLIATYNSLIRQQGVLVIRRLSPDLRELLHLLRLDQRFHIEDTQA